MAAVNNSCQQYVTVWLFTIFMKPILFSVFRFIRTFYLVVYNLMQGALFLYITSVLLYKLLFQGTGTVKLWNSIVVSNKNIWIHRQYNPAPIKDNEPYWWLDNLCSQVFSQFKKTLDHMHGKNRSPRFQQILPVKESSVAKSHHERILPPQSCFLQLELYNFKDEQYHENIVQVVFLFYINLHGSN